jgi:hypothetical protein
VRPRLPALLPVLCLFLAACGTARRTGEPRLEPIVTVAIAPVKGGATQGGVIARKLAKELSARGLRAVVLEDKDEVLSGSFVGLRGAPDPRLLREIRRTTGADAVALLDLERTRAAATVSLYDTRTAQTALSERRRPSGAVFKTVDELAAVAARAIVERRQPEPEPEPEPERESPRERERRDDAGFDDEPATASIGANVIGGQLAYHTSPRTRFELRYQAGKTSTVRSSIAGLRAYRLFWPENALRPYIAAEAAYVSAQDGGGGSRASGAAGGAVIGVERRLLPRLWIGVDAGPYLLHLREQATRTGQSSLVFVLNTSLMFYIF